MTAGFANLDTVVSGLVVTRRRLSARKTRVGGLKYVEIVHSYKHYKACFPEPLRLPGGSL